MKIMINQFNLACLHPILFCLLTNVAAGGVVYSTFGVGTGYGSDGVITGGPTAPSHDRYAEQFFIDSLGPDYLVDEVTFAVIQSSTSGSPITAVVSILQDNADSPDIVAGVVAQVEVSLPLDGVTTTEAVVTANFNAPDAIFSDVGLLSAGQAYWAVIEAKAAGEFIWADSNDSTLEGYQAAIQGTGSWQVQFRDAATSPFPLAAYSIGATAVPEPGPVLLWSVLGTIWCGMRRWLTP